MHKKVRWGVLGSAKINEKILPGIVESDLGELSVFGSRNLDRALCYAKSWGFKQGVESYEAVLESPNVDVVYISLPNDLHFEWCKKAVLAGKHVLCEKPIFLKSGEVKEIQNIVKGNGAGPKIVVSEALMYRHHLQTRGLLDLVEQQALGPIRDIQTNFGFTLTDPENIRLQRKHGGGSLWDLGCYAVDLILQIISRCGQNPQPTELRATATWNESGVDVDFRGELIFDQTVARFHSSFQTPRTEFMQITGEKGILRISRPYKPGQLEKVEQICGNRFESYVFEDKISPYVRQILDFQKAIFDQNESAFVSLDSSYQTIKILEALETQALKARQ